MIRMDSPSTQNGQQCINETDKGNQNYRKVYGMMLQRNLEQCRRRKDRKMVK